MNGPPRVFFVCLFVCFCLFVFVFVLFCFGGVVCLFCFCGFFFRTKIHLLAL